VVEAEEQAKGKINTINTTRSKNHLRQGTKKYQIKEKASVS